ncbi:MAG TPA: purine-nucleoside phosphorylase [Clostridiales bacterium]|nr:purine-nucleoside phosphorylase [Clostridiales bacterium]
MYNLAAKYIEKKITTPPNLGIILGSGLSEIADFVNNPIIIEYKNIPNFPISTVKGHKGRFVVGNLANREVIIMQGRFHYYEGYNPAQIALPVRVMAQLGVKTLIITNAAGGINPKFKPGDLMIIRDHINISGINPLRGENDDSLGPRFPDMTNAYTPELRKKMHSIASKLSIPIHEGVYSLMLGPSYETPAEIKMLSLMGADAVGMSTVPEVIAAVHCGINVVGISCITNMAAGILDKPLSHEEVICTADMTKDLLRNLIMNFIEQL